MANERQYDIVKEFGLYCYEMKSTDKSIILKCTKSGYNKETKKGTAAIFIDVVCTPNKTDIAQDDYTKQRISVDGGFSMGEYTPKSGGDPVPTITIFADRVTKVVKNG